MGNRGWLRGLAALAVGVISLAPALQAQDAGQASGQPARAVRLSYVDGQVRLSEGNQVLAAQAVVNTQLFEGMQLTTADTGKAEIQFEDGSVARLAPDSSLTLKVLRGQGASADAELVLDGGLAYFEFQGGNLIGQMRAHFGDAVATASGFTVFRITMDNPPGELAVFSGNIRLEGGNGALSVDLHSGESVALNAADLSRYDLSESIEPDSWDAWNSDRDQALSDEAAAQTGASANLGENENPAWNDLDANGNWYDVPGQGYVWSPNEAASAGFDPYGNGSWMWTPGFGYLWASGYPWGYLPYQCGMWNFYSGFGWGWAPGLGGCAPWWGMGFYGGPNIGLAPVGYRPIRRPISPRGPVHGRPIPMVAVNRHVAIAGSSLPARDKSTPVTIAGNTVQALRPLPSRPVYDQPVVSGSPNRALPGNTGAGAPRAQPAPARPIFSGSRPPSPAPAPSSPGPRSYPAMSSSSSSGHSSSGGGSSSHSSGGGSSGGGSHSSGGGGGGGGSHGGGGGGGGGSHGGGGGHGR